MTGATTKVRVADNAQLCVETIGDREDPALLLIAGATWSMDWWDDELCRRLADRGRLVIRYDQRDTGRSTTYPAGSPGYGAYDLVTDAVAVLDALHIGRAHVVGLSMGGGTAQLLALDYRERIATLTLISTSPIDPGIEGLPGPTPEIRATFAEEGIQPDWNDRDAIIDYIVEGERPYAGPGNFDEARLRALAGRVFDRSDNMAASMINHFVLEDPTSADARPRLSHLDGIPTLVLHGTADPMFPPAHGKALVDAIPGARLIELDDVGHQLPPPHTWDLVVDALTEHTETA
ncbi:alpha/beta hydrolase [Haloechinothrix sp. LS1_15]|uniref:alpha/beta fold hydrolase n=1 Tax=Haloechinothrix sp. LS1_15 TaxID=2652248 RepID=UPI00294746E8|nr:alpha/beta hydrolase [Haloechinothrix sp. LS1_15]MDV6011981.1 alpha/beta hydrolase [Haloechinothrix sp. LS1_15]